MPSKLDYFTAVLATGWAIALSAYMTAVWFIAYINDYRAVIYVNVFGEAQVEFAMWIVVWVVLIKGGYTVFKVLRHERTDSDEF